MITMWPDTHDVHQAIVEQQVLRLIEAGALDAMLDASRPRVRVIPCATGRPALRPAQPPRAGPRLPLAIPPFRGEIALIGCAVPFGEVARVAGGLEVVWPGAFKTFLACAPRVVAGVNHRPGAVLGSTHDGRPSTRRDTRRFELLAAPVAGS